MEAGKKAMESVKETAANVAASARSGMEKTKATVQEKGEKMTSHTNFDKNMAEQRKENRIAAAELNKQAAQEQNAGHRAANTPTSGPGGHTYSTTGESGYTAGPNQMSATPGHGTGEPAGGHVVEGTVGSHPIGKATGTTRSTTAQNPRSGAGNGGSYTG